MASFILHRLVTAQPRPLAYGELAERDIAAWFSPDPDRGIPPIGTPDDRQHAWEWLQARILADFGQALMKSPGLTGRYAVHRTLPAQRSGELYQYHTLADAESALVAQTPQHHTEMFQSAAPGGQVYGYDGRVMYLACLRFLPCLHNPGDLVRDGSPDFLGRFRAARYRCAVVVPDNWQHMGLVPAKAPHSRIKWVWPRMPGEAFECWLSNMEVAMLLENGWHVAIQERLLFSEKGSDPLRPFAEKMTAILSQIDAMLTEKRTDARLALRMAARRIVVNFVGTLHQDSHRWQSVNMQEDSVTGPTRRHSIGADGTWTAQAQGERKDDRNAIWARREWSSHIWAMARVKTAQAMLRYPFDSFIAMNGDAFYTSKALAVQDTGRIGEHRLKEGPYLLRAGLPLPDYNAFKRALYFAEKAVQ